MRQLISNADTAGELNSNSHESKDPSNVAKSTTSQLALNNDAAIEKIVTVSE